MLTDVLTGWTAETLGAASRCWREPQHRAGSAGAVPRPTLA
ncbi:hypothetical protein ACIA8H_35675 [Streptomyces goshikiensis]